MSIVNGKIVSPISIKDDIGTVTGTNSGDIATNIQSGNINKWAKFKPTRWSGKYGGVKIGGREQWEADTGRCGLAYWEHSNIRDIHRTLVTDPIGGDWPEDVRPRGRRYNEWFRVLDFDGYNPNATCAVSGTLLYDGMHLVGEQRHVLIKGRISKRNDHTHDDELWLNEIPTLRNFYPALLIWRKQYDLLDGMYEFVTHPRRLSQLTISSGDEERTAYIPFPISFPGEYWILPMLSATRSPLITSDELPSAYYVLLPLLEYGHCEATATEQASIGVEGFINAIYNNVWVVTRFELTTRIYYYGGPSGADFSSVQVRYLIDGEEFYVVPDTDGGYIPYGVCSRKDKKLVVYSGGSLFQRCSEMLRKINEHPMSHACSVQAYMSPSASPRCSATSRVNDISDMDFMRPPE